MAPRWVYHWVNRMLRLVKYVPWLLVLMNTSCTAAEPLDVVDRVDPQRYMGRWYEIASYPAWFQRGCTATTADYRLRADGKIQVINRCRKHTLDGPPKESEGVAEIVDTQTNAKLKVWFFWPFKGNYWIIDLAENYAWAVVGEPRRKYLWILSRTPTLDEATYQAILARLPTKGYDPARLRRTPQIQP